MVLMCGFIVFNGLAAFGAGALACSVDAQTVLFEDADDDDLETVTAAGPYTIAPSTLWVASVIKPQVTIRTQRPQVHHQTGPPQA